MHRRAARLVSLALLTGLLLPAGALANAYTQVEQAYSRTGTGALDPCRFSSATLAAALRQAPSYDLQYQADFTDAIQAALAARADGECRTGHSTATTAGSLGSGARLRGANTQLPGSVTAATAGGLPLVLVLLVALVAAGLLVLAAWLGFNALGYDPGVARAARQALAEAEYRIGARWEDMSDRLRR